MSDHYEQWSEAAAADTHTPIPPERLAAMFLWSTQCGPPNCWTGTLGLGATFIRELLRERILLAEELERVKR